ETNNRGKAARCPGRVQGEPAPAAPRHVLAMIDSGPFPASPATFSPPGEETRNSSAASLQRVEERIRRLEDAVAALQDQRRPEPPMILPPADPPPQSAATAALLET